MTGRVIQARQTISGSNPPEGIFAFSHNLVGVTEWFLDAMLNVASPMLRRTFERTKYLTEFALLLHSISLAFEQGRVPKDVQLSVHDLALLLKVVTGTIDRNYRAPHNWGRLVEGKIEETCTRILRDAPTKDGPAYGHMSPTLGALEFFSVYPAVVNHMIAWDHEGHNSIRNVAMHLPDTEHTIRLKQLPVEGAKRADIYSGFRDSHQLFICDNSSVGTCATGIEWEVLTIFSNIQCSGLKWHTASLSRHFPFPSIRISQILSIPSSLRQSIPI
jgi:uncharacterized protein YhhL (DUF1145 family)